MQKFGKRNLDYLPGRITYAAIRLPECLSRYRCPGIEWFPFAVWFCSQVAIFIYEFQKIPEMHFRTFNIRRMSDLILYQFEIAEFFDG